MRRVTPSLQIKSRPSSGIAPTELQIPAREAKGPWIGTSRQRSTRLRTSRSRIRFRRQIFLRTLPLRSRFLPRTYTLLNVKRSLSGPRGIHVREPRQLHVRILRMPSSSRPVAASPCVQLVYHHVFASAVVALSLPYNESCFYSKIIWALRISRSTDNESRTREVSRARFV